MKPDKRRFFLGIDAGGTNCRAKLVSASGSSVAAGTSGPGTLRLGIDVAARSIIAATNQALALAGIPKDDFSLISSAAIGIAGSERSGTSAALHAALQHAGMKKLIVTSDAHTACLGAHEGRDGGVIIVGTGSIGFAIKDGETLRVGGHGFPASDQGSGAHIGLEAASLTLRALDGLAPVTTLTQAVYEAMGGTGEAAANWLAAATATEFASLAPLVVDDTGEDAEQILMQAGAAIARLIIGLRQKGVTLIALTGGLAESIEPYVPAPQRNILSEKNGDPVDGALLLAGAPAPT